MPSSCATSRPSRTAWPKRDHEGPSLDGEPTVLLTIRRQSGTNTVAVVDAVKERLAELAPLVPAGYEIRVVRDLSEFIKASIDSVEEHLVFGSILAAAVVLVFLWNWRSTIIAAIAIPTSIIATFGLIWYQGFTLNSMTMLALTLAVGIVIDDAIVVLENIYRFVEEKGRAADAGGRRGDARDRPRRARDDALAHRHLRPGRVHGRHRRPLHDELRLHDVVRDPRVAARQLHADADAGGALDQDEAAARGRRGARHRGRGSKDSRFFRPIDRGYTAILKWSLAIARSIAGHRRARAAQQRAVVHAGEQELPPERRPVGVRGRAARAGRHEPRGDGDHREPAGDADPPAAGGRIHSGVGRRRSGADAEPGTVYVRLKPLGERSRDQFEVMNDVRANVLPDIGTANLRTGVRPVATIGGGGNQNAEIQFTINGPDLKSLERYANAVAAAAKKEPGVVDVDTSLNVGKPELSVNLDRSKAADLGVPISDAAEALRLLVGGDQVTTYNEGGEQYEVHVRAVAGRPPDARRRSGSCRCRRPASAACRSTTWRASRRARRRPKSTGSTASARSRSLPACCRASRRRRRWRR